MKNGMLLFASVLVLCTQEARTAESNSDSLKMYWLEPVSVQGQRPGPGEGHAELAGADIKTALHELGLQTVQRGAALTGDLSAGAFKRGDIEILIDGERHPNACPNRMDNASTRLNPEEMASMELMRSCCSASCGLGGSLEYHRQPAGEDFSLQVALESSLLAANAQSLQLGVEGSGYRFNARVLMDAAYEDGEGQGFQDLYPFSAEADARAYESSLYHNGSRVDWGLSFAHSEDIPFPYLMMDERETDHLAAHLSWRGHKLYYNQTDHLMDNGLRTMNGQALDKPTMISDARNSILGLSGDFYHLSFYQWDLDNVFNTMAGPIANHMIPELSQLKAEAHHRIDLPGSFALSLRAGIVRDAAADVDRVEDMQGLLISDPDDERIFLTHGLALQSRYHLGAARGALMLESASQDPGLESLWISVRKPAGKAWWIGNPELDTAMRHTLRAQIAYHGVSFEAALSQVSQYAGLVSHSIQVDDALVMVQTYQGVRAHLFEAELRYKSKWLKSQLAFNWGQDLDGDEPLAEIPPLHLENLVQVPLKVLSGHCWLRHTWNAPQGRVSTLLKEAASPAWNTLDLGLSASRGELSASIELENLLDHAYSRHLSYARNPFSAGLRVMEPGRMLKLRLRWMK